MLQKPFNDHNSRLALGCQHFGYDPPRTGEDISTDESFKMLDMFVQAGGSILDTARSYHIYDGRPPQSERCIGSWLRSKQEVLGGTQYAKWRERLIILSKGCYPRLPEYTPRITEQDIYEDMCTSLDVLGTDIDIWLLHRDDPTLPVDEIVDSLVNALSRVNGKGSRIRATGASNWTAERIGMANDYSHTRYGIQIFAASEVEWSLALASSPFSPDMVRMELDPSAPTYEKLGIPVLTYTSQAKGLLCDPQPDLSEKDRKRFLAPEGILRTNDKLKTVVQDIAETKGLTPAAVSLLWLIQQESQRTIPVLGCKNSGELSQALPLLSQKTKLSAEELRSLQLIRMEGLAYLQPNV